MSLTTIFIIVATIGLTFSSVFWEKRGKLNRAMKVFLTAAALFGFALLINLSGIPLSVN